MAQNVLDLVDFYLWWESADGDARNREFFPEGLAPLIALKDEFNDTSLLSVIEIAFLFTEILMKDLDSKHERFLTIEEWLEALATYYQSSAARWDVAIRNRLIAVQPKVKVSAAVYKDGNLRSEIPRSRQAFKAMFDNDAINFTLKEN